MERCPEQWPSNVELSDLWISALLRRRREGYPYALPDENANGPDTNTQQTTPRDLPVKELSVNAAPSLEREKCSAPQMRSQPSRA